MTIMTARQPQLSLVCRAVVYQMCLMMALQPAHPAFAEGIAVATGNTTLNQAGNGVPIVDISTPNGAGISHNLYTDFNVGQGGAILNNATGQLTQTQLGGLIQNNPHLGGQAASAIINEVIGVNPSQLQGYLEVAGQQAGVVVANPNGLTCDGCGFINTPTVTLSTGKPVLDAQGQLQMLDVKRGTLTVAGKGLDASRQASVDLVARAVQLNGALHGKEINVIAGANQVNRQTGEIRAQAGEGPAPEVAIDTAALGGMYAGKIRLVSTEQGVGVNLANAVANQGDLTLDASGKIRLRDSSSTGALRVEGRDDVALTGKVQAGGSARIGAAGTLSAQNADIRAAQNARLAGKSLQLDQSSLTTGGTLTLQADEKLKLAGGKLQADAIDASARDMNTRTAMVAKRLALQADQLRQEGELQGDSISLAGKSVRNDGKVQAGKTLHVQGQQLDNKGLLKSGQSLTVTSNDSGRNDGVLSSAGSLEVRVGDEWRQGSQGKSESGTKTALQAGRASLDGEVAAQQLAVNADALTVGGKVRGNDVQLTVGKLSNQGEVQAGGTLSWQGKELDNRGSLQGDKRLVLKGDGLNNRGALAGGDTLGITAGKLTNGGRIASQDVAIDAHQLNSDGTLLGVSRLSLKGDELVLTGQQLTDGELQLGSRLLQLSGQTLVGGKAQATAKEGEFGGLLKAQSLVLAVNQANSRGKLHSREGIAWQGERLTTGPESELIANQSVTLTGQTLSLGGTVGAGNALTIEGKQVGQTGALVSGQGLNIRADTLSLAGETEAKAVGVHADEMNVAGKVRGNDVQLTVGKLSNQGEVQAGGTLSWQGKELDNRGSLQGDKRLVLKGDALNNRGALAGGDTLGITAGKLTNGGRIASQDVAIDAHQLNSDGTLLGVSRLSLKGDELVLTGQQLTDGELQLGSRLLQLSGQTLVGGKAQATAKEGEFGGLLKAQSLVLAVNQANSRGKLHSREGIAWQGERLTTGPESELIANQSVTLTGQTLSLGGTVGAGNALTIEGKQVGQTGALVSGQGLNIRADTLSLAGETEAKAVGVHADEMNVAGKVRGNDVQLTVGKLSNQGEVQAGGTLSWQGRELDNSGSLQGDKRLVLKGDGLNNRGALAGGDTLGITAGKLTNGGRIASQDVAIDTHQLNSDGTLLGVSRLSLKGDELVLTGQQLTDGELQLGSRLLQLSGQTLVGGKAQATAKEGEFDGVLKAQSLVLAVNQANSRGKLHSREGLQWLGQHLTTGQNSELIANQGVTLAGEQLTLGGILGAGNALNIQGKELNQSGTLVSGQAITIKADDLSLAGLVQGQSVQLTSDRGHQHGRLLASDSLAWQSKQLEGNGWMQAGADLTLSGDTLIHKGTALAQGRMALDFADLGSQGGLFARDMVLTGSRLTLNGALETTRSTHLQGDTLQLGGESRIGTDLILGATLLSLSGTQQIGGALQLEAKEADLGGALEVGEDLNVKAETLRSAGKVLAKQADIEAKDWGLQGTLATDDALVWRGARLIQQGTGALQAGGKLSLSGGAVSLAGTLAAKGHVGITAGNYVQLGTLNAAQGLNIEADKLQLGGSTQARTAALQSREGLSSGQHLATDGFIWQSDLLTNKGWLQAGKDLALTTRTLDNDGTLIAGGKHSIEAQERLTNQGSLAGNQLSLTSKALQSSGLLQGKLGIALSTDRALLTGRLTSQGAVQLGASLLTLGGNADIGGSLTLKGDDLQLAGTWRVGGLLHSTGKQLTLDGDWQASQWQLLADSLVNKGRLASEQAANLNVGKVHNQQGATLVVGGQLTLVGKSLLQEGSWLGADDQSIKVDDVQQHGQWVGDGTLQMEGSQFNNSGALRAASMGLAFDQLTNRGRMESLGEFGWEGKQWHNLGALIAGGATLSGQHLINSGDVGVHRLTMKASDRLVNNGVLVGKDQLNLTAATLDSQGDMLSSGDLALGADSLTLGGLTQAKNQLALTVGQATLAGNVVADRLQWGGQHLTMGGTTVAREADLSGNQISLEGIFKGDRQTLEAGTLTTGKTSSLLAKEKQQLKADQMTLQGSIVAGLQQKILATALTQQGVLASGGSLALQVVNTLHNEGNISSETLALEAGHIDNGGALVSKRALLLQTGDLINRGHWQSDQGITLTASRLLNSGSWISGLAQSLTLGELDNSGTLQSGSTMTLTAQHLDSRGKLLANQDMSLTADEMTLEIGSTTASNGRLTLNAEDVSSAGMLSAADGLSWQGQRFNHRGTTVTDGALRLQGETLTLDGVMQGGTVTLKTNSLTTGGRLNSRGDMVVNAQGVVQHGGQLQGGNLVLNSASWQGVGTLGSNGTLTLRTGQLQQQGPWRIRGATNIQADHVTLNGSLISGGDLTLLSRGELGSKVGSQLVSGGNLSVEGTLLTQQGLWQSEREMQIKGSRFEQQGNLLAGTDLGLRSGSWQQNGKVRANGALNASLTEHSALAGMVQADGGILLSAPSLTLKGTLASKGNVNLTTASQLTQLGNLLSGGELALGAARIDQQGRIEAGTLQSRGELQNDGIMLVAGQGSLSGARLDNGGTLQGDGLAITNAQLDNRGALLANNLAIINAGVQNHGRVQGGSVRLETQSLDNQQGAVLRAQNQGDISATTLSNAGELSSGNRLILKGNQFSNPGLVSANWLEASPLARLVNSGTLFGQQLTLKSGEIHAPGKILAGQKATLEAGRVTGIGEWLSGGDLSLKVGSSLNSQGTLSAKGILDLQVQGNWQHQGEWGAGQRFNAGVTGQLNNSGTLVSNGMLLLNAQQMDNSGSVQAGTTLRLDSTSLLRNIGMIASQGDQTVNAGTLYNEGTFYSDGKLSLTASNSLTNQYGTILAERDADVRVHNGNITNSSGTIESTSNLILAADDILNQRAKFVVSRQGGESTQPPQTKVVMPKLSVSVRGGAGDHDDQYTIWANYSRTVEDTLTGAEISVSEASAEGRIAAGQHLQLVSTRLNNAYSNIAAGGNITIQSGDLKNESLSEGKVELHLEYGPADGFGLRKMVGGGRGSGPSDPGEPKASLAATYVLRAVNEVQLEAGRTFNSFISAGGNLTGTVAGMIDNVTIKANAGPVSSTTQRPGMSLPQAQGAGVAPGLQGDAQYLSQVLKPVGPDNGVPMPDFQLPSGDKGLFTINHSGDSPYLIEVNPLLANLGQSGNGMMDRIDTVLQQQLQGTGQLSFDGVSGNGGVTQANGQNANWSLPGRVIGGAASPDFQALNGVKPVNNGHATVSQQWQPGQGINVSGQGLKVVGGSTRAVDQWQQSLQQGFNPSGKGPQVAGGSVGAADQWQQSLQQGFNPSGQGLHISGGHSGAAGQWQQSLQDGFSHGGVGPQVTAGAGQVAGQWQQSLQHGWQGQAVSGVTVTAPGSVQINSQPVPAVVTAPVVETSPVLTQVNQFLGSSYFFTQVGFTPEKDIKLLGDAAFDTRVIRDAVLAQTGRRFISNELGSDLAQMRTLIDNAAKNQRELGLSAGVALSAEQVAQLGRSMVWWEPVWYQGKIVLAPKLYLTEADKRHLSGSVITATNIDLTAGGINNSGTLLADGTLSLKSGSTLVNQGQIQAGGRLELIAKGDILNQNLIKGGEVAIASLDGSVRNETQTAQRHVDVNGVLSSELTDQTRFSRTDVGDIARIESTGNLLLQAGQDISLSASNLLAGLDMSLSAGRDITIGSLEDRSKWEEGQNRFARVEQLMSSLDAGRSLALSADRDLNISATSLTAKGDALLQAGNELSLKTADNQTSLHTTRRNGYDIERQSEEVGVNLTANNIALRSGGDLNLRAASVQATEQLSATAGRDLLIESGETTDYRESYTKETKKKAFSKKTTTTHDIVEQHAVQASDLGGQYVLLKAQQDMNIKGSNVVGDLGATLLAGRDLNISAVDLLSREMHFSETKRSGLMGSGGLGVTIGKQQQSSDMMGTTLAKEGSSVGSVQGNVTLQAGNQLVVAGSDVIAGKDILMVGKDVAILSEQQNITRKEEFKSKTSGLTLALTGGAVTAVQAAYDTAKTSKESSNDRLVALQGTKAAMSGYQAWEALQSSSGSPGGVPDASFVGIAISVGNQRSHSSSQSSESNAFTSEINAGGDVTIVAKGDAANTSGDLLMTGSSVKGQNVTLGAARDLVLRSAVNSSDTQGSNHSSGWNVGLSIGVSQGSVGISIFANMNAAKGKENGDSDRYTETNITAGNALTLTSGRDATLLGAMVSGDKVNADIGRNLTLTSQQDNDHYQSKQSSIAAGGSFTFGSMSGSGYINASRQKINSDFESVVEQTGIFAGKQGFDIRVGEHTQLNGAVLAGSEDDSKNRLSTGTLGWSDLVNRADYKVESQSIGISSSGGSKEEGFSGKGAMTAAAMLGGGNSSGSASSTTHASISAGQIEIRNEEAQQQDLVTLHRDPTQAANGLSPIFDKQKELERMQEAQMIGEVGQQATQLVVTKYLGEANEQAKEDPKYAQSKEYKELQAKWGVGSDFQRGMQAATAALQGLAGGDITQAAAGAAAPYLAQLIKQQTPEGPSRVMAHALVQGALAAAQNKNAMVSATGAATGELVGMLATELYHKEASQLTEGEKETVSTLATLAAGLAGGLTGAGGSDVLASAQTGKTVVENNTLSNDWNSLLPSGLQHYGQAVQSYAQYAQENNLPPEQVQADLARMVKGDQPEGTDIIEAILSNNPGSDTVMALLTAEEAKDYALALLTSVPAERALSLVGKVAKIIDNKALIRAAEKISTAKPGKQFTSPRDLNEHVLWNQIEKAPSSGIKFSDKGMGLNNDPRFPKSAGFEKMTVSHGLPDGSNIEIHYQYNSVTNKAYDMKIVTPKRSELQPGPSFGGEK